MAESQSTRDMQVWLAKANAEQFSPSSEFGDPSGSSQQKNPTDIIVSGAGRDVSSDGSLDKKS
jgi:hypothetical protein